MLTGVRLLAANEAGAYASLVDRCAGAMFYHTPAYLGFLRALATGAEQATLVAEAGGRLAGALPCFIAEGPGGRVLNALPYFGSHGDVLIADDVVDRAGVADALFAALGALMEGHDVAAVNLVAHPLDSALTARAPTLGLAAWDRRISQITELQPCADWAGAQEMVLATCKQKTRNLVRKALRAGFEIAVEETEAAWAAMIAHHRRGMERIGGKAKSDREFALLRDAFGPHQRRLYVARKDGAFAGALLNFHYRQWVEYFTPVIVEEHRAEQPLSALIAHAMCEAALEGRTHWNWGGTWTSQAGVRHFKSGWGARDREYAYWGAVRPVGARLLEAEPAALGADYPYFYVRPFGRA